MTAERAVARRRSPIFSTRRSTRAHSRLPECLERCSAGEHRRHRAHRDRCRLLVGDGPGSHRRPGRSSSSSTMGCSGAASQPITGHRHERLWALVTNDVAVYSAHLPLDVHPRLGNNALLARRLGLTPSGGFARYQAIDVGLSGSDEMLTRTLATRAGALASEFAGTLVVTPFDPARSHATLGHLHRVGRGLRDALREAASRGLDTLIVGEGPHHTAVEARELGIVVLYAGHYATETLGVRALGDEARRSISGSRRLHRRTERSVTETARSPSASRWRSPPSSKRFGADTGVARRLVRVRPGTVHALLGENGAGKTTLMRIALRTRRAGLGRPSPPAIPLGGFCRPRRRSPLVLGMVHQHFTNVPAMTVAENVALGTLARIAQSAPRRRCSRSGDAPASRSTRRARAESLPVGAPATPRDRQGARARRDDASFSTSRPRFLRPRKPRSCSPGFENSRIEAAASFSSRTSSAKRWRSPTT